MTVNNILMPVDKILIPVLEKKYKKKLFFELLETNLPLKLKLANFNV